MKNFVIATTAGAIVGAAISMTIPSDRHCLKNRIFKKGKKAKSKIVKEITGFMYRIM